MNILNKFKEESASIYYYGKDDMATGFQIKSLIDNFKNIESFYTDFKYKIESLDDYINFIFIDTYSKLEELEPLINPSIIDDFKKNVDYIKKIKSQYKQSIVNKYIRDNYESILDAGILNDYKLRKYEIINYTFEYIRDHYSTFKESKAIYNYLFDKYSYRVLYNLDDFIPVLEKYKDLLVVLLSPINIELQINSKIEDLRKILIKLKKVNSNLYDIELYKKTIETISNIVVQRSFNTDTDRVMQTYTEVEKITELFENIRNPKYYEFKEELEKQKKILNDNLYKKGIKRTYEIKINEIMSQIKNSKEWEIKSLKMTHTGEKMVSLLGIALNENKNKNFNDIVNHIGVKTNNTLTYSVINRLEITSLIGSMILKEYGDINEIIKYIYSGIANFNEDKSIDMPYLDLDFGNLTESLSNLFEVIKEDNVNKIVFWSKTSIIYTISIIEKVLREIVITYSKSTDVLLPKNLTLERILNSESINEIIGYENSIVLRYYLCNYNEIGKNIRNDVFHNNNDSIEACTFENVLQCLYLLLTISNELLLRCIE